MLDDRLFLALAPDTETAVMQAAKELGIGPDDVVGHAIAILLHIKDGIARGDQFYRVPYGTETPRAVLFTLLERLRPPSPPQQQAD